MPKPRKLSFETPTARLRLPIQKKPHWQRLGPGVSLGYRRNAGAGTWSIRAADGRGDEWLKKFAIADDYEPADGKRVLSHSQAIEAARLLVRGDVPNPSAPPTVKTVLASYGDDLRARGANTYNARWPLKYLPAALLSKPVTLIDAHEWRKWRDSLIADLTPAGVNRVIAAVCAACNLAASHDSRLASHRAWQVGLQGLPDANRARNIILPDDKVRELVDAAYRRSDRFGCLSKCSRPLARGLRRRAASKSATFASTILPSQNSPCREAARAAAGCASNARPNGSARRSPSAWRLG
jgi:hypothetical protein